MIIGNVYIIVQIDDQQGSEEIISCHNTKQSAMRMITWLESQDDFPFEGVYHEVKCYNLWD